MTRDPELDALKAALAAAPPADPAARSAALARAMEAYENSGVASQGMTPHPRSNPDRPQGAGVLNGVRKMLATLKLKPVLALTTSAAALAMGAIFLSPQGTIAPGTPVVLTPQTIAAPEADSPAPALEPEIAPLAAPAPPDGALARKAAPEAAMADMAIEIAPSVESAVVGEASPEGMMPRLEAPADSSEAFAYADANPVKVTTETPVSTFSVDVDTASYAIIRDSLMSGVLPDADAVRIEEMVNYFPYAYDGPDVGEAPFRPTVTVMPTPWNANTRLVHIGLQGRLPEIAARPPLNLVFLIDTSGSMQDENKLPLLRQSLAMMLGELRPDDQVAIVAYAGSAGEVLPATRASERATILAALDRLDAGGATAGEAGLALAYDVAGSMTGPGEISRVLLATDGDFNVGVDDPEGLETFITKHRETGIYLSVLGFGRGNLDDATMQALAQSGNGQAAYIDTLQEARKVLVDQLTGALFPIANDVKIQVEWNPAQVAEYRLIGYETRALAREDFNNDAVDAGEIGAGHQVTAIYEITAPGSPALLNDPLRYGTAEETAAPIAVGEELGFLRLRYKAPGEDISALIETPITAANDSTPDARFAAAIAGFGQLLRASPYLGDWGWDQAIALAEANRGADAFGYRVEAVNLMRLAQSLPR